MSFDTLMCPATPREVAGPSQRVELSNPVKIVEPDVVQLVRREQQRVAMELVRGRRTIRLEPLAVGLFGDAGQHTD